MRHSKLPFFFHTLSISNLDLCFLFYFHLFVMPLLDAIKKPKQVAPASDSRFTSSYMSAWNTYNEHDKQNSFVHVPLSPPVNRYSRYYRYKNHLKG